MMLNDVSRETAERLDAFRAIFQKWAKAVNLVSPNTLEDLDLRHIADSAQIARLAPNSARSWTDIGTGGGFPGLIVAAMQAESHPQRIFTLVESDQRKGTFLREAARAMGLNLRVITARIEDLAPLKTHVLSARALGSLEVLCAHAQRHLASDGLAIFLKGETYAKEVLQAKYAGWTFDVDYKGSMTQPGSVIVLVQNISRDA